MNRSNMSVTLATLISTGLLAGLFTGEARAANRQVEISALVEAGLSIRDTTSSDPLKNKKTSDFTVSRMELHFNAQLANAVSGHIGLLYRDSVEGQDGTDSFDEASIDEISVTLGDKRQGWSYSLGKMILPFGNFSSGLITDPLTQIYAEIHETAFIASYFQNGTYMSLYAYNSDLPQDETVDDKAEHYGMNIGFASNSTDIGVSYIDSVGDSDYMQNLLGSAAGSRKFAAAASMHFAYTSKGLRFVMENIKTLDAFADNDFLIALPRTVEPEINHVELGFPSGSLVLTIGYQSTSDAAGLLPESRLMTAFSKEIMKGAMLTVEYTIEEDYSVADGGSGDESDVISAQLGVSF